MEKIKSLGDWLLGKGPEPEEDEDEFVEEEQEEAAPQPKMRAQGYRRGEKASAPSNVVSMNGSKPTVAAKPNVVLQKVTQFEEVYHVADILKDNRIVVLNLEACPQDIMQRVIDILYGVSYALDGSFEKIAGKAFVITPKSVSVTGAMEALSGNINQ